MDTRQDAGAVEVLDSLDPLAAEWDELALRSGAPPFARPGWIGAWREAFGRGSLTLLALRRDGELAGVLPLERRRRVLHTCANVHTPVFDCVASDRSAAEQLLAHATGMASAVLLERVEAGSLLAEAARRAGGNGSSRLAVVEQLTSPYVQAGADAVAYVRTLGSSRRRQMGRKRRRLGDLGELTHLSLEGEEAREQLEERFAQLLDLEASG